jgi:hypothetical protein
MGPVGKPAHISPRAPGRALVRRSDGRMLAGRPGRGAKASSSRASLPASGGPTASPERERVDPPPPHFAEAQVEQELWEELRDHGASLNRALNEALRIHGGLAWRVFQVRGRLSVSAILLPLLLLHSCFP